jgi:xanthine/uracil permease
MSSADEHTDSVTDVTRDQASVRRAPRYARFLGFGVILGVIVAAILTFAFPENNEFDRGQVFGFLLLVCGTAGFALGAIVALVLDRVFARRARGVSVEHESTHPGAQPETPPIEAP